MEKVKQILNSISLLAIVGLLIILLFKQCEHQKYLKNKFEKQEKLNEQNISAINDLQYTIKKNDSLYETHKTAYVASLEDLKKYNTTLYNAIKNNKNDIIYYLDNNVLVELKDLIMNNKPQWLDSNTLELKFDTTYKDPGLTNKLYGSTFVKFKKDKYDFSYTNIKENSFNIKLAYTFQKNKETGKYEVVATVNSPKVTIDKLNSAYILTDKDRELLSTSKTKSSFGVGPTVGVYYDYINKRPLFTVGLGLNWNIIPLGKKK